MKKKILITLALILVIGTIIGAGAVSAAQTQSQGFRVGYAIEDITPTESVPLEGYGSVLERMSQTCTRTHCIKLDCQDSTCQKNKCHDDHTLKATAVALTDEAGETVLMITLDLINAEDSLTTAIRNRIVNAYPNEIKFENIIINNTHTHSGPARATKDANDADEDGSTTDYYPAIERYREYLKTQVTNVAKAAMEDRNPIDTMKVSSVDAVGTDGETLNSVRHYLAQRNSGLRQKFYMGDNFGSLSSATILQNATEVDPSIRLLVFEFPGTGIDPVVLANWRAHPTAYSAYREGGDNGTKINYDYISSDFVGEVRDRMEAEDVRFAYFQGTAGNVNPRNRMDGTVEHYTKYTCDTLGQALAGCIMEGLDTAKTADPGRINSRQTMMAATLKTPLSNGATTYDLELHAITIGEHFAMATAPMEMFDTLNYTADQKKQNVVEELFPEKTMFVLGYTNDSESYMPSSMAYDYKTIYNNSYQNEAYEVGATQYVQGTYEQIQREFITMLSDMEELHQGCECGGMAKGMPNHTCQNITWEPWDKTDSLPTSGNYYLINDVNLTLTKGIAVNGTLHLDLNNCQITLNSGSKYRAYILDSNDDRLTITDSSKAQTGAIVGAHTDSRQGLLINAWEGEFTLYGGTLDATNVTSTITTYTGDDGYSNVPTGGAAVYVFRRNTFNMYGGTIKGGTAVNGDAVCVNSTFNMYGGTITDGKTGGTNKAGDTVYMGRDSKVTISGGTVEGGIYADNECGSRALTVTGASKLIGNADYAYGIRLPGYTNSNVPETYADVLVLENLTTGAQIKIEMALGNGQLALYKFGTTNMTEDAIRNYVTGSTQKTISVDNGNLYWGEATRNVMIGNSGYVSVTAALEAYDHAAGDVIVLMTDMVEDVELSTDIKLDLAGYTLSGSITGTDATIYGMDSANNGYDATKCGSLNSTLEGVTVAADTEFVDGTVTRQYVALKDSNGYSFHRVYLKVTSIMLRPDHEVDGVINPGLYYQCTFAGDEAVVDSLTGYGVAARKTLPDNHPDGWLPLPSKSYTYFQKDATFLPAYANTGNGTMIQNIMTYTGDENQPVAQNVANAETEVYGRPYMALNVDGVETIVFGETHSISLKDAIRHANGQYQTMNATQKAAMDALYKSFSAELLAFGIFGPDMNGVIPEDWDIPVWGDTKNPLE